MFGTGIHEKINQHYAQFLERTLITEGILFPDIYRRYVGYRDALDSDRPAQRALQLDRLQAQLTHATTQVPAYRHLDPRAPLADWPLISKADLRDRLADFCDDAIDVTRSRAGYTSGTTGIPVKVVFDFAQLADGFALALRRNTAAGLPLRRRILIPMCDGALPWTEYASPGHGNSIVAQFGSTGDDVDTSVSRSARFAPDVVYGHPSSCLRFARAVSAASLQVQPKCVLTCGEKLDQHIRDELEATLAAPVRDGYGMCEFGTIAVQCERGKYHIESERLWVEIVDEHGRPAPSGQPGELVVTDLVNRAMPLIRYRTGDIASLDDEACGCGYPGDILSGLEGRDLGTVCLDGGVTVSVITLTKVVRRYPLRRFQLVHRAKDHLEVLVSLRPDTAASTVTEQLTADLRGVTDHAATVTVRPVADDGFLLDNSAKQSDFVSLI